MKFLCEECLYHCVCVGFVECQLPVQILKKRDINTCDDNLIVMATDMVDVRMIFVEWSVSLLVKEMKVNIGKTKVTGGAGVSVRAWCMAMWCLWQGCRC